VGLVAFGLRFAWVAPRLWRNDLGWDPDRPPAFWALGLTWWRGLVRCSFLAGPMFLIGAPGYALDKSGAGGSLVDAAIVVSAAIGAFVLFVLMPGVFLFNKPRWVVVPHLRHQHGALAEWRGKRSAPTPAPGVTPRVPLR